MKRDTSYADQRIAEELAKPLPKRLEGVFEQYPMSPPRSDVAIALESSGNVNPIRLLKDKEEIVCGGTGGRAGRDVAALLAPSPGSIIDLKPFPVSQARQEMAQQQRSSIIDSLLSGPPLTGFTARLTMNPDFVEGMIHELQFGKVERHPRKAFKSFKRASKAMVRQFRKEVKHG